MTMSNDKMRHKTERSHELAERYRRQRRAVAAVQIKVPDEVKDEIVDEIIIEIAMAYKAKDARKAVRAIIDLWID